MRRVKGFTLVELVVVIIISGILSLVTMQFISAPIEVYVDLSRRVSLVDEAQTAMQRVFSEVRHALPNSLRVGCAGDCVEFLSAVTGGRYRNAPVGNTLSFVAADSDSSFEVLGTLNHTDNLDTSTDADACRNGDAACVVVYNTGFAFPATSPGQRFFITDTPVTFLCDAGGSTLRRYQGYTRQSDQTDVDTHAELIALANPAENALLARRISDCDFSYSPGTSTRNGVLTVRLSISEAGETVFLLQQIHVSNIP